MLSVEQRIKDKTNNNVSDVVGRSIKITHEFIAYANTIKEMYYVKK